MIRKQILLIVTSMLLIISITTSTVQANTNTINENIFIDNHIEALVDNELSPIDRAPELNARVRTNVNEANNNLKNAKQLTYQDINILQPSLYSETVALDTLP